MSVILFSLLHFSPIVIAQRPLFTNYTMNEGLVHNNVRCIYQDSKGFIWLGTWEGLSKYDGNKFTNYTTANGLAHDLVNDIYETKDGRIYIACNDGSLHLVMNNEDPRVVTQDKVIINRLRVQPDQRVLAVTDYNGIQAFKDGRLAKYQQTNPTSNYYDILQLNDSLFVALSTYTLEILDKNFKLYCEWKESSGYFEYATLYMDAKKRIWVTTPQGLKLLSPRQDRGASLQFLELPGSFDHPLIKNRFISDILEDHTGNFWIGTTLDGLLKISTDGSHQVLTEKSGLPARDISCIYEDREKNLWFGTSLGLAKLVTKNNISIYTESEGLLSNMVYVAFPLDKKRVFIETEKGAQIFDRSENKYKWAEGEKEYFPGDSLFRNLALVKNKLNGIRNIMFSRETASWFSFGPHTASFSYLFKDKFGNIFYPGGPSGLMVSRDQVNWEYRFREIDVNSIYIDSKHILWIGSRDSGLYRVQYEYVNNQFRVISQEVFLKGKAIRSFFEDSKGYLWVGTRYNGIFCINKEDKIGSIIHHFDRSSGLSSNRIVSIGEDKTGALWICFYYGFDKLLPQNNSYRVFNFSDFNNFRVTIHGMFLDYDNSLWLATAKGLFHISDDRTLENTTPLKTYITQAALGDSVYRNNAHKITLGYKHKQIRFEFAAPGAINEKQVYYSYRLIGSNNTDWSQPSIEHSVSYASLQPGTYRFEVRTLGWNGQWGESDKFEFSIQPPFWQTWWFYALVGLVAILIFYALYRYRISQLLRLQKVRNRIASDLHDDIGSTLTNINMLSEISRKKLDQPREAERILNRISEEVTSTSQALNDIIWSVNSTNDSIDEVMTRMRRYAAELFDNSNTICHLYLDEAVAGKKLNMEQRRDLYLIYKESMNNIHKYAVSKNVWIDIHLENGELQLKIKDDGKGFQLTQSAGGNGLRNIRSRAEKWKGSTKIETSPGKGTFIEIKIPLAG